MNEKICSFSIPSDEFSYLKPYGISPKLIEELSILNIFIGPNNSGKSRLLRQYVSSNWNYSEKYISNDVGNSIKTLCRNFFIKAINGRKNGFSYPDPLELLKQINQNHSNYIKITRLYLIDMLNKPFIRQ